MFKLTDEDKRRFAEFHGKLAGNMYIISFITDSLTGLFVIGTTFINKLQYYCSFFTKKKLQ